MKKADQDKLIQNIEDLRAQLAESKSQNAKLFDELASKIDKKNEPAFLEKVIVETAVGSIAKSIELAFSSYDSPIRKMAESTVLKYKAPIEKIMEDSMSHTINSDTFKEKVREVFATKVAKCIVSNNDGVIDKVYNDLRQNPEFRARATLAIGNIAKEFIK